MKITKDNKIYIVIGILVVAAIGAYFLFFRKKGALSSAPAVNPADEAAYNELYNYLAANIDRASVETWLSDIAKEFYTGKRAELDESRKINGQMTKTGALMSAYATSYYPNPNVYWAKDKNQVNNEAYAIFYRFIGQINRL